MLIKRKQTTSTVLMIRPAAFGFNPETAANNAFQQSEGAENTEAIQAQALVEFDAFVEKLRSVGVHVIVVEDRLEPVTPDAVFPNNWISFHTNGMVVTYPMFAPTRRGERRGDVFNILAEHYEIRVRKDFSHNEKEERFLEGTGSLVLDRRNRLVYACLSPRTDADLLEEFCEWADYKKVRFHAVDATGQDIYHTNVMMGMGDDFVVICMDAIRDEKEKMQLKSHFHETKKEIINISLEQMNHFAGNMLQVENQKEKTYLVMSEQAFKSLNTKQISQIERHTTILHSPLYTIEKYGGGSARCMLAEVFLPKRNTDIPACTERNTDILVYPE